MKKTALSHTEKKYFKFLFLIFIVFCSMAFFYRPLFGLGLVVWFLYCSVFGLYFWPKKFGPHVVLRGWKAHICSLVSLAGSLYILINDILFHNYIDNPLLNKNFIGFGFWYFLLLPYFLYILYNIEKLFLSMEGSE